MTDLRSWPPFSEIAPFFQAGRTIEDPHDLLVWLAMVRRQARWRRQDRAPWRGV